MTFLRELRAALRRHWPYYLAEAVGLALFMTCASLLTLALEHPASALHQLLVAHGVGEAGRRGPLGVGMGLVIAGLTYNPWGHRSGAHINPAITLAFWQLGRIKRADALWYGLAQAGGGLATALGLKVLLGAYYAHPSVHFVTTQPGPQGAGMAFAAEFVISFGLMLGMLLTLRSARWHKAAGWVAGVLIMLYIFFETPYSGMSLNPFRSLGSAVAAEDYRGLWVYFVAPPAAMCLAAWVFRRFWARPDSPDTIALPHHPDPSA